MDFNVVESLLRVCLVGLADRLCGCSHRRTTFPITLRANASMDGRQGTPAETYVACLECGRHVAYDWTTMRVAGQREAVLPQAVALGFRRE